MAKRTPKKSGDIKDVFKDQPFTEFGASLVYPQYEVAAYDDLEGTLLDDDTNSNMNRVFMFEKGSDEKNYAKWNFKKEKFDRREDGKVNVRSLNDRKGFDNNFPFKFVDACLVPPIVKGLDSEWPAYFFCEKEVVEWDLLEKSKPKGKEQKISDVFPKLPKAFNEFDGIDDFDGIDAVCVLPEGVMSSLLAARAVFFRGEKYVVWDLNPDADDDKRVLEKGSIKEGFLGLEFGEETAFESVDNAFVIPKSIDKRVVIPNDGFYLFSGKKYVRWDVPVPIQVAEYPKALENIRFNKCPPLDERAEELKLKDESIDKFYPAGGVHKNIFPLDDSQYPLTGTKLDILKRETTSDSVVVDGDVQLDVQLKDLPNYFENGEVTVDNVTQAVIKPLYPSDEDFWNEMRRVIRARRDDLVYTPSDKIEYRWPDLWYKRSRPKPPLPDSPPNLNPWPDSESAKPANDNKLPQDFVAQSVRGEFSNYHQQVLLVSLAKAKNEDKVELATDLGLPKDGKDLPIRSKTDFIGMQVRMAAINAYTLEAVAPFNFYLKWYFGVPRPEEVAWLIFTDKITAEDGVPTDVIESIKNMKLEKATDFTAYDDGSPTHPSFPAMHSAGSTCSLWVPTVYKLTKEQFIETLRMDYAVAFARTVAGVHYPQDNIAGLNIGQRIIRNKLPHYLMHKYGYDSAEVKAKVEALSFDWSKFDVTNATIEVDENEYDKVFEIEGKKCLNITDYVDQRYNRHFGKNYFQ